MNFIVVYIYVFNVALGRNRWPELLDPASKKEADPHLYHTEHNSLRSEIMAPYEKVKAALDNKEAQAQLDLLIDDFVFVRHQTGGEITKAG